MNSSSSSPALPGEADFGRFLQQFRVRFIFRFKGSNLFEHFEIRILGGEGRYLGGFGKDGRRDFFQIAGVFVFHTKGERTEGELRIRGQRHSSTRRPCRKVPLVDSKSLIIIKPFLSNKRQCFRLIIG